MNSSEKILLPPVDAGEPDPAGEVNWRLAAATFAALLAGFWAVAGHFQIAQRTGGHFPSAFASFALVMAPFWAFGFGAAGWLKRELRSRGLRILAPAALLLPYLVYSVPSAQFQLHFAVAIVAIPVGMAALLESVAAVDGSGEQPALTWQDLGALAAVGLPVEFGWLAGAWPGLSAISKLLLVDATLYGFLVSRALEGVGYDFRPRLRDLAVGLREWAFFAPIGIGLGSALAFISFHARWPSLGAAVAAWLVTFFFVAIPEELFFRGLLLKLLEPRLGRLWAVVVASAVFGLSHFNKGAAFNWRYVLLAFLAGIFYARAWLDRRRLFTSGITHATVDVVWSLWFR